MDDLIAGLGIMGVSIGFCVAMLTLLAGLCWVITFIAEWFDGRRVAEQYKKDVAAAEAEAQAWKARQQWLDVAIDTLYYIAAATWQATECEDCEEIDD